MSTHQRAPSIAGSRCCYLASDRQSQIARYVCLNFSLCAPYLVNTSNQASKPISKPAAMATCANRSRVFDFICFTPKPSQHAGLVRILNTKTGFAIGQRANASPSRKKRAHQTRTKLTPCNRRAGINRAGYRAHLGGLSAGFRRGIGRAWPGYTPTPNKNAVL